MDVTLIATAAMTILVPYVTKAAGKFAEKIGEDLWTKVKGVFKKDKEIELVKKADEQKLEKVDLVEIESSLVENLKQDADLLKSVTQILNITPANAFILSKKL